MPWTPIRTKEGGDPHPAEPSGAQNARMPIDEAGRWCGAVLQVADVRLVPSAEEGDAWHRTPAQWFYVLWQPRHPGLPPVLPDQWGLLQEDPRPVMTRITQAAGATGWLELDQPDCAWSLWLEIPLNCEALAHWQRALLMARRDEARCDERQRQRELYGSMRPAFDRFMQQVLQRDVEPDLATAITVAKLFDGLGAEQARATVAKWADGTMFVKLEPLDFGGPRLPDLAYRFDAPTVATFQLELALLCGGELFADAEGFVRVVRSQFESLRQGLRWLRQQVGRMEAD